MESALRWADYLILALFLVTSLGIGVYHSLTGGRQKTTNEFIMANRNLGILPTAISMFVSFQSAIMMLGCTAEMYMYGSQHLLMVPISAIITCFLAERIFVPWLYPLKLVSVYEYLAKRFRSREIQSFGASLGVLSGIMYMGTAMYAPSAALEAVTGFPISLSIPLMAVVSVAYTALGGMRAVIWTDVFQCGVMLAGMIAILIKGSLAVGGIGKMAETCGAQGRMMWANWSPDPTERHTVWGYMIGSTIGWLYAYGLSQASVQRFSATKSVSQGRTTILLNIPALCFLNILASSVGLFVVAYYAQMGCDPLANGSIQNANQLLPYFVTQLFANAPGFVGLFLATLYGGALSSISSSLSGASANFLEDVLKWRLANVQESTKVVISRVLVVVFGLLATGIAFLASAVPGPVTQVTGCLLGSVSGPVFGMFMLGGLTRIPNWKGTSIGAAVGFCVSLLFSIASILLPQNVVPLPPLPILGCSLQGNTTNNSSTDFFLQENMSFGNNTVGHVTKEPIYTLSYVWLTSLGLLVTVVVGFIASLPFRNKEEEAKIEDRYFISWRQCFVCNDKSSTEKCLVQEVKEEKPENNNEPKKAVLRSLLDDERKPRETDLI